MTRGAVDDHYRSTVGLKYSRLIHQKAVDVPARDVSLTVRLHIVLRLTCFSSQPLMLRTPLSAAQSLES